MGCGVELVGADGDGPHPAFVWAQEALAGLAPA